jgi:hypothetical protein
VACLAYAVSLPLQRGFPVLREALTVALGEDVSASYYLRVLTSLALGAMAAAVAPRRPLPEELLAWGVAGALGVSVILICLFP